MRLSCVQNNMALIVSLKEKVEEKQRIEALQNKKMFEIQQELKEAKRPLEQQYVFPAPPPLPPTFLFLLRCGGGLCVCVHDYPSSLSHPTTVSIAALVSFPPPIPPPPPLSPHATTTATATATARGMLVDQLQKDLKSFKATKERLETTEALLRTRESELAQLRWDHDVMVQRFEQLEAERDELYDNFVDSIRGVQQKTGFRNLLLERKLEALAEELEKKDTQLAEVLSAANLQPAALAQVTSKLSAVLDEKNDAIRQLQFEVRVCVCVCVRARARVSVLRLAQWWF